jgi:hypothetical protein
VSTTGPVNRPARIVHHHLGATRRQQQRVLTPQPGAGTGDDSDPVIKTNIHLNHSPLA